MFPEHCNKCFAWRKFDKTLELHVSRCGHIFCKDCIQPNCTVCLRPTNSVPISTTMPQGMAEYFMDPMKYYKHFQKILKFHIEQERLLVQHHFRQENEKFKEMQRKLQGFQKMEVSLKTDLEHERERLQKCREYVAYYERRMENANYMQAPIQLQPRLRYAATKASSTPSEREVGHSQQLRTHPRPPRTPTLSANNSSDSGSGSRSRDTKKTKAIPSIFPEEAQRPSAAHFEL